MTPESESGSTEEGSTVHESPSADAGAQPAPAMGAGSTMQEQPKPEGKRTQLKIVRENVESLSRDVENFRKSHDASSKALEARMASLRKQLDSFARSKDLDDFARSHKVTIQKLEKQVSVLKADLAALKSHVTKEMARTRAKEDVMLSKILSKVSAKPKAARPSKPKAKAKPKAKPAPKPMKKA